MKIKTLAAFAAMGVLLSSCGYTIHTVTNNPIGSKTGVSKAGMFSSDADFSYHAAAKNGKISKIGSATIKVTNFGAKTIVTGE